MMLTNSLRLKILEIEPCYYAVRSQERMGLRVLCYSVICSPIAETNSLLRERGTIRESDRMTEDLIRYAYQSKLFEE